jgi:outer membrane protein TolC
VNADLSLSWNILDFGLSYVRAHQAADEVLIAREKRRKAIHSLLQDVRLALWKAVAAEKLASRLQGLDARIKAARGGAALSARSSPLIALTRQRELLELKIELERLNGELRSSKTQLAVLMNLPPGTDFRLSKADGPPAFPGALPPAGEMVAAALQQRPELRQAGYGARINQREAEAALLELLPGVAPFLSANTDTNSYLYNSNWVAAGAKASWNLMKLFTYPHKQDAIQAEGDLISQKALAMAMTIMAQVHVSRLNYMQARKKLQAAQELFDVERKILKQMSSARDAGSIGGHSVLRQEMRLALAEVKRDLCYAEYEGASGTLFVSVGADVISDDMDETQPVQQLSQTISQNWRALSKPPFFIGNKSVASLAGGPS